MCTLDSRSIVIKTSDLELLPPGIFAAILQVLYIERTNISVLPSLVDLKTLQVGSQEVEFSTVVSVAVAFLLQMVSQSLKGVAGALHQAGGDRGRTEQFRIQTSMEFIKNIKQQGMFDRLNRGMFDHWTIWPFLFHLVPSLGHSAYPLISSFAIGWGLLQPFCSWSLPPLAHANHSCLWSCKESHVFIRGLSAKSNLTHLTMPLR